VDFRFQYVNRYYEPENTGVTGEMVVFAYVTRIRIKKERETGGNRIS